MHVVHASRSAWGMPIRPGMSASCATLELVGLTLGHPGCPAGSPASLLEG